MPPPLTTPSWTPLLTGADAERATDLVAAIAAALRDPGVTTLDPGFAQPGLSGGASGAAVFFAERAGVSGDEGDADTALEYLDRALEQAGEAAPYPALFVGAPGVGWTLAYLERSILQPDDAPNDVDEFLDAALAGGRWRDFDVVRGVVGGGVYLLERRRPVDAVVDLLRRTSVETEAGTTWFVDPRTVPPERAAMFPDGYYDVGLAHGQAGVVAFLAHAHAAGAAGARPLLDDTVRWLRAQRLPEDSGPGRFPLLFGRGDTAPAGGRLAWCYGDIGVAVALLAAGRALGDDGLVAEARDLAHDCAGRSYESTGVVDVSVCHGSAGLALLFARLAHGLGDDRLADAARRWAGSALDQVVPGEGVAGVRLSVPAGEGRAWEPRAGLLEGAAGVGLTLLALTSDRPPDWDAVFLTRPVAAPAG